MQITENREIVEKLVKIATNEDYSYFVRLDAIKELKRMRSSYGLLEVVEKTKSDVVRSTAMDYYSSIQENKELGLPSDL